MRPAGVLIALLTAAALGCASAPPRYRSTAGLKSVVMGEPKATVMAAFGPRDVDQAKKTIKVEPMRIRATRQNGGEVLEVGEVPLTQPDSGQVTYYWFLFKNDRLAMWGRPQDWRSVPEHDR